MRPGLLSLALLSGSRSSNTAAAVMSVQMVDMRGRVVARTDFSGPSSPYLPGCGALIPPPVRVAAGAAFYADAGGVVHRLAQNGTITEVATFKLSSPQQFLSFAVSPDGQRLIAIIFSTPPLKNPLPEFPADPFVSGGHWTLDLASASSGGATTVAFHRDFGTNYPVPGPTFIAGWDDVGPTATLDADYCFQQRPFSSEYTGSALIHLGLDGTHLDQIGGPTCVPLDELRDGTVLCHAKDDLQSFTVRRQNGELLWGRQPACCIYEPKLAPDASGVTGDLGGLVAYLRDSSQPASPPRLGSQTLSALGWAGPQLLVVVRNDGHVGLAPASNPRSFADLGLVVPNWCLNCLAAGMSLAGMIASA